MNRISHFRRLILSIVSCLLSNFLSAQVSPHLSWSTYFGEQNMTFTDNAVDGNDNLILVGKGWRNQFATYDPGLGAYFHASPIGSDDGIIAKFDSLGQRLWATYYGSAGGDHIEGVAVNSQNHIMVVGDGGGGSFPLVDPGNGAYYDNSRSGTDGLITRFDELGRVVWSTYFGGSGNDYITDIVVAEHDNIWITGYTQSADFPTLAKTGAYFDGSLGGFRDWFIAKFDSTGKLLYSTYYGFGNNSDYAGSLAYSTSNGHVAVCGSMEGTPANYTPSGAYASPWSHQGMIVEFDSTGQRLWATRFLSGHIAFDANGNLFFGARWPYVYPTSVPLANPGGGAHYQGYPSFVNRSNSGVNYFAKFNSNHALVWGTCAHQSSNPNQNVRINDITIDQNQNLVAVGRATAGLLRTAAGGYYQGALAGGFDGTIQVFSNGGVHLYGSYYGGSGANGAEDYLYTVTVNSHNEYLVGGVSRSKSCQSFNIPTRDPGNAYYDGIGEPASSSPGALLPLVSRFSPSAVSGISNSCQESFRSVTFPVEWLGIRAAPTPSGSVDIDWSTASEVNNHYFEVERSVDARSFSAVGQVYSQGDAQHTQTYRLEDQTVRTGRYYYRIKQVDLDGQFSYSPTVQVDVRSSITATFTQDASGVYIHSESPIEQLSCWDLTGKPHGSVNPHHTSAHWPTAHLPAGMYLFQVQTQHGVLLRKVQIR